MPNIKLRKVPIYITISFEQAMWLKANTSFNLSKFVREMLEKVQNVKEINEKEADLLKEKEEIQLKLIVIDNLLKEKEAEKPKYLDISIQEAKRRGLMGRLENV